MSIADRRRHAGVSERHDDIGRHRAFLGQLHADALACLVDADPLET